MANLYHVSECGSIERFDPKPAPSAWSDMGVTEPSVWAIDEEHLINYLLPRDCPRVTYYALEESKKEDIERLLGPSFSRHIVAIEEGWLERAMKADIWIYEFQNDPFIVVDQGAGYFISRGSVIPVEKRKVENPLTELISRGAELRIVSSLWPLRDAVLESSLQFSFIRMRNAKPREMESERESR